MPGLAVNQDGLLVEASNCGDCPQNTYYCHMCNKKVRYCRSSSRAKAYFKHTEESPDCSLYNKPIKEIENIETTYTGNHMSSWHKAWQNLYVCNPISLFFQGGV